MPLSGIPGPLRISDLAAAIQHFQPRIGRLPLQRLPEQSDEEVIRELIAVKGIGRWTAQMHLIFSLGRPDILATDDLGLRSAIRRLYGLEELPTAPVMERVAEPWRPYRSIASWYLWRSLDKLPT